MKVSRTGINPLLWLVGLITPPSLFFSVWTADSALRIVLFVFAATPPAVAIVAYFMLLFLRPEMLESEEYRLRRHELLIRYRHGDIPESLQATAEIARLESRTGEDRTRIGQ
ncbi:MAG: hypothetical protein ACLPN5_22645 [Roseiarcus sp.]